MLLTGASGYLLPHLLTKGRFVRRTRDGVSWRRERGPLRQALQPCTAGEQNRRIPGENAEFTSFSNHCSELYATLLLANFRAHRLIMEHILQHSRVGLMSHTCFISSVLFCCFYFYVSFSICICVYVCVLRRFTLLPWCCGIAIIIIIIIMFYYAIMATVISCLIFSCLQALCWWAKKVIIII